jgi:hypothetical protein
MQVKPCSNYDETVPAPFEYMENFELFQRATSILPHGLPTFDVTQNSVTEDRSVKITTVLEYQGIRTFSHTREFYLSYKDIEAPAEIQDKQQKERLEESLEIAKRLLTLNLSKILLGFEPGLIVLAHELLPRFKDAMDHTLAERPSTVLNR